MEGTILTYQNFIKNWDVMAVERNVNLAKTRTLINGFHVRKILLNGSILMGQNAARYVKKPYLVEGTRLNHFNLIKNWDEMAVEKNVSLAITQTVAPAVRPKI